MCLYCDSNRLRSWSIFFYRTIITNSIRWEFRPKNGLAIKNNKQYSLCLYSHKLRNDKYFFVQNFEITACLKFTIRTQKVYDVSSSFFPYHLFDYWYGRSFLLWKWYRFYCLCDRKNICRSLNSLHNLHFHKKTR